MFSNFYAHRWEPLAEVHFSLSEDLDDYNYIYCLCSRVFIRDSLTYGVTEKEELSESDGDARTQIQPQWDEHSHVHFSTDTSYKEKFEKDEIASCYCSASHTDNNYSTDEHDAGTSHHVTIMRALQTSDSGADLTYQEGQSESGALPHNSKEGAKMSSDITSIEENTPEVNDIMDEDVPVDAICVIQCESLENYLGEASWARYWAVNGERLIWASWINKYSDYINPSYLEDNKVVDLIKERELNVTPDKSPRDVDASDTGRRSSMIAQAQSIIRERKFSYDSKVNPYKTSLNSSYNAKLSSINTSGHIANTDDAWVSIPRQRSSSEHERLLSPRTLATTDSLTNVTKITVSSYDMNSSHVTTESSRSDEYSVSSTSSDDNSNEITRVGCGEDIFDSLHQDMSEEIDPDEYWQVLWKKHFGEQYAKHFENYAQVHKTETREQNVRPVSNVTSVSKGNPAENNILKPAYAECENSDGNSQELPSVVEVRLQAQESVGSNVSGESKSKKKRKKDNKNYIDSVGMLLQHLLIEQTIREVSNVQMDDEDERDDEDEKDNGNVESPAPTSSACKPAVPNTISTLQSFLASNDGDDEPPAERPISLKRSHDSDSEESATDKIKATFVQMGLNWDVTEAPKGQLVYRKRMARLRPPRRARQNFAKKTYFDDDGKAISILDKVKGFLANDSSDDVNEMQTDDDISQVKSDDEQGPQTESREINVVEEEADNEPDTSLNIAQYSSLKFEDPGKDMDTCGSENADGSVFGTEAVKRKRRKRRSTAQPPVELIGDKRMLTYWKRRHSLFSRFDNGIRLDIESWFSVTPEKVAVHLAERCRCDLMVDAFCGAGGNAIQFAFTCERVIAIDIDPEKIELAQHNAAVYGVADRIEFIVGDFFELADRLTGDVIFLSPPWGGPQYNKASCYDLETMLLPKPSSELMSAALKISQNVALYVPRTSKTEQLVCLAGAGGAVEVEQSFLDKRLIALTAYYGGLVNY